MSEELKCSICDSEMDIEGRGGISGEIGILPVAFCEWCYSGITSMFESMFCAICPGNSLREESEEDDGSSEGNAPDERSKGSSDSPVHERGDAQESQTQ